MRKIFFILAIFLSVTEWCSAQKFIYDVDFLTNFDNREYHSVYQSSQTIFGIRLSPSVGVEFTDSLGGVHRFVGGLNYVQPFGATWNHLSVSPIAYYRFDIKGFTAALGFIPYGNLKRSLPSFLMSDSLVYAYPNIQGALFQYESRWGYAEAFCDWRGMMSRERREAFRIIIDGRFRYEWFFFGGYAQLNHLANRLDVKTGVCDDACVNPFVGIDFSRRTPLDSLEFSAGYLFGYQRDRKVSDLRLCHGLTAEFFLKWKMLAVGNTLYYGDNQMPFYGTYGSELNQGEPWYQAPLYNKTNFRLYLVQRPYVNCWLEWDLHYTWHEKLSNQQRVVCRFNLGKVPFKKKG